MFSASAVKNMSNPSNRGYYGSPFAYVVSIMHIFWMMDVTPSECFHRLVTPYLEDKNFIVSIQYCLGKKHDKPALLKSSLLCEVFLLHNIYFKI